MRLCIVIFAFVTIFSSASLADTRVVLMGDEKYISIESKDVNIKIRLYLLEEAIRTTINKNVGRTILIQKEYQKMSAEKMIARLAYSLNTLPVVVDWSSIKTDGCILYVKEDSTNFSINLYPVLCALKIYFKRGLIRPGIEKRIEEGLANGFLSSLDRYSSYWSKVDAEMRMCARDGYIKSIGVVLCTNDNTALVYKIMPKTPAERKGLKPGDRLIEVDGVNTEKDDTLEITRKLWGEVGTKILIKVIRPGSNRPILFTLQRAKIIIQSVFFSAIERNNITFGIIKIDEFNANTPEQYDSLLGVFLRARPRYIVVDLRDNRGGYVHIVQDLLGRILDADKLTLIEEYSSGKRFTRYSRSPYKGGIRGRLRDPGIKIICLVSAGTASGGEVLASALRDADICLVGEKTYGKGLALAPSKESSGDGYYYQAEWRWLTSRGVCIEGIGLTPDIEVRSRDRQMEKAIEQLLKK